MFLRLTYQFSYHFTYHIFFIILIAQIRLSVNVQLSSTSQTDRTSFFFADMQEESDPNVIYGGDADETSQNESASLGDLIVRDLKIGGAHNAFVSFILSRIFKIE